jgi:hypothetical protein
MFYETIVGLGTIFFIMFFWVLLMKPLNDIAVVFKNITPTTRFNVTLNRTAINSNYDLGVNVFYFFLFFLVIVIIIWIMKVSVQQQKRSDLYGG